MADKKYSVPALDRALDVIELLSCSSHPLSLSAIAESVNKTSGELFRIMDRLVKRGYVIREAQGNTYSLSLRFFEISHTIPLVKKIIDAVSLPMAELTAEVNHSCHITILEGGNIHVLYEQEGLYPVHIHTRVGSRIPASLTGSGRILLALMSDEERKRTLQFDETFQSSSPEFREECLAELDTLVGQKVYIRSGEQYLSGVRDFIAPIKLYDSTYITLSLPCFDREVNREIKKEEKEIIQKMEETVHKIELLLGSSDFE